MANLPESPNYHAGIYQLEKTDPVEAGPSGIANRQAEQLGDRTAWLHQELANTIQGLGALASKNTAALSTDTTGTLALTRGGTGATDAVSARANLGLGSAATTDSGEYTTALDGGAIAQTLGLLSSIIGQLARQTNGGRITLAGGSLDDPALRIGTASIYSTAADTLSVAVAGAERLRITTSGITVFGTVTEV